MPGAAGNDGADGADGADGVSAYTTTSAQFTQPAADANVAITVANTDWMAVGQTLYIANGGYYQVVSIASETAVTVKNLGYTGNAAEAATVASGSKVSPGGVRGAAGAAGAGGTASPLTTKGDIWVHDGSTNVRLPIEADGSVLHARASDAQGMVWDAIDLSGTGTTLIRSNAPLRIQDGGTGEEGVTAAFDALAPTTTEGDVIIHNGTNNIRLAIGSASRVFGRSASGTQPEYLQVTQAMIAAGGPMPRYGLLGSLISADFNSTADQAITILSGVTKYIIRRIVVTNANANLTTAVGGVYGAASKSAPNIVANTQVYSALTASSKFVDLTLTALCGTDIFTQATIYLSLSTAQGSAATGDIYIFGENVT